MLLRELAFLQNINVYLHLAKVREEQKKRKVKKIKVKEHTQKLSSFIQHNPGNVMIKHKFFSNHCSQGKKPIN